MARMDPLIALWLDVDSSVIRLELGLPDGVLCSDLADAFGAQHRLP